MPIEYEKEFSLKEMNDDDDDCPVDSADGFDTDTGC